MAAISGAAAQTRAPAPVLAGTWQVDTPDGPQLVIVRPDSSASFGEEIVRWRLLGERLYLAFGDEWIGYDLALAGDSLTLSGGDLEEPVTMKRVGPPKPRPPGVEVPPAPPFRPPA
jgi:hypothetical protein